MLTAPQLGHLFIDFFIGKNHTEIPPAPLVPENDPTTLFISAGIQPLVPYFLGKTHPAGSRLVNVQKCVRTVDVEEVGDAVHHTFFEMLGNWSLGDYFKKEMIPWSFEFLTQQLNLPVEKLAFTCFAGDADAPRDDESAQLWLSLGVSPDRIAFLPKKNNWWGPPGITGPCGPDTEMFYWTGDTPPPAVFDPQDSHWVEIWNDVLIQYFKNDSGQYEKLVQNNIDTGMGAERTLAILLGLSDNYLTPIWQPIIQSIQKLTGNTLLYQNNTADCVRPMRIIADHLRAAVFLITDGVIPSNKERGYVLRRLIRRAIRQGEFLNLPEPFTPNIAKVVIDNRSNYAGDYPELTEKDAYIIETLTVEETKFRSTLQKGLREITKLIDLKSDLTGQQAFNLYQTYGFPIEMIEEELSKANLTYDKTGFDQAKADHINQSRSTSAGMFKAGLADHTQTTTRYHTATHLLHQVLRQVLGNHVHQAGSNITGERLRFDFTHPEKLTADQLKTIESRINQAITDQLPVTNVEMDKNEAIREGALAFFPEKYPQIASVYTIGDPHNYFSKELCGGPHVASTGDIGPIKITKEESAGAGIRRIYAQLVSPAASDGH